MLILLTNDDGINAEGIQALADELGKDFPVEVVAPDQERSASSHSITLNQPLTTLEFKPGWRMVTGTSADCVNLAVNKLLPKKPDLVISGINRGANLGCDVFYSGTVAGAREAGILGIPAFAVSVDVNPDPAERGIDYQPAAEFALKFAHYLLVQRLDHRLIFNLNFPGIPREKIKGAKFTRQGVRIYSTKVLERNDQAGNKCYLLNGSVKGGEKIEDSDIMAVEQGFISITPLALDFTDYELLSRLKNSDPEAWLKND